MLRTLHVTFGLHLMKVGCTKGMRVLGIEDLRYDIEFDPWSVPLTCTMVASPQPELFRNLWQCITGHTHMKVYIHLA